MNSQDRDDLIIKALAGMGGGLLFAWSFQTTGQVLAALVITIIGGLFLLPFIGPPIALLALIISLVLDLICPPRPAP